MKTRIVALVVVLFSLVLSSVAQVTGSGSSDFVPIWINNTTLGNSTVFQTQGMVGIGTTTPTATLNVVGQNATLAGQNAPTAFQVTGGIGGRSPSTPGAGGPINLTAGQGAFSCICNGPGGPGGVVAINGGTGGHGFINGGIGGPIGIAAGPGGGITSGASGGSGGTILLAPGTGATYSSGSSHGGNGGSVTLLPGSGGTGNFSGSRGNVLLAPSGGKVGIGETNPANTLEVKIGGTTLADAWTTRSSRRFKTDIQPLQGALGKVERLQGVSYRRKGDGQEEIGVVAEDVAQVVPEVVSNDPNTHEVQGVDYARLVALLIEAVKSQQDQIQQLKTEIQQLTSATPKHNRLGSKP